MSQILGSAAKFVAGKQANEFAHRFEPEDPYYEYYEQNGKQKRRKRALPPGLSKKDAKILRKVMRRAHYLDKGFHICGIRFGWTFLIGLIPLAGDITDALLNYHLVVKKAKQVDGIPESLIRQMMMNNAVSIGVGVVPLVGDIALAAWKTNWRNAALLEKFLRERGAANLAGNGFDTQGGAGHSSAIGTQHATATGATHGGAAPPPVPHRPT
ncbi:uncharacterized protein MJAP1_000346 [Malassezia japonica]|uniref:Uncharacterized protein n=1 Tax=Malassezia japonica TaxID=223818 RepID=A0AAF0F2U9_9BASI|nr:uncharacterized protein MJAP1_000346 [Malassezia japonica]WFD37402.1 hypothetical protein MJAP1_000346 [Malassezia japonica]